MDRLVDEMEVIIRTLVGHALDKAGTGPWLGQAHGWLLGKPQTHNSLPFVL